MTTVTQTAEFLGAPTLRLVSTDLDENGAVPEVARFPYPLAGEVPRAVMHERQIYGRAPWLDLDDGSTTYQLEPVYVTGLGDFAPAMVDLDELPDLYAAARVKQLVVLTDAVRKARPALLELLCSRYAARMAPGAAVVLTDTEKAALEAGLDAVIRGILRAAVAP